jgi:hypothetical protein
MALDILCTPEGKALRIFLKLNKTNLLSGGELPSWENGTDEALIQSYDIASGSRTVALFSLWKKQTSERTATKSALKKERKRITVRLKERDVQALKHQVAEHDGHHQLQHQLLPPSATLPPPAPLAATLTTPPARTAARTLSSNITGSAASTNRSSVDRSNTISASASTTSSAWSNSYSPRSTVSTPSSSPNSCSSTSSSSSPPAWSSPAAPSTPDSSTALAAPASASWGRPAAAVRGGGTRGSSGGHRLSSRS